MRRTLVAAAPAVLALVLALACALAGCMAVEEPEESQPALRPRVDDQTVVAVATATPALREPVPPAAPIPRRVGTDPQPDLDASAAIVIDEQSGEVLFALAPNEQRAPASLTKIATAVLALESGRLDESFEIDLHYAEDLEVDSSVAGLEPGDRFTLRQLLYALMLPSGNDAAVAIARALAGSEEAFVAQMNTLAADLRLTDTHFIDVHGLGGEGHYTTARDLANLTRYAFTLPEFAEIVSTQLTTIRGTGKSIELWNGNEFLYYYDGADGVKVGYTEEAGDTIVASATRDGRRLIAVVLRTPLPVAASRALFDWVWENVCWPSDGGGCERVAEAP